jgi:hypothetical protein
VLDAGVLTRNDADRFRVYRENGSQLFVGTCIDKRLLAGAVIGMVLPVGLGYAHVQLTTADSVDVVNRAAGGFNRAANAVLFAALVDQAADCATGRVVNAGYTAGTNGYECLICRKCRGRAK